ncbi:hypothetical protein BDP27DRAFT_913981 [Rhodocollybia butyracea]|uniref:DUF6534 domain-containing protein n=1 Tax=Rhodocollybia butyracea TaxID=206335 RepID=A0A9P5PSS4_9AGAR|nr:hypothetical protein BDP27DRAFT_913981 [Rhodocollybia butyracea]
MVFHSSSNIGNVSFGALLVACWVNIILFALEVALCVYFLGLHDSNSAGLQKPLISYRLRRPGFKNIPSPIEESLRSNLQEEERTRVGSRWFLICALFNDTLCTILLCVNNYDMLFSKARESSLLWTTAICTFSTCIAVVLEQSYFLLRYWGIAKNLMLSCILGALIVVTFLFILVTCALSVSKQYKPQVLEKLDVPLVAATMISLIDITLASALVWSLKSLRSIRTSTRRLLHKISMHIVGYGCMTAISSLLLLAMWMVNINGYLFIAYCLGRIYSLTVLLNFVLVSWWRAEASRQNNYDGSDGGVGGNKYIFNDIVIDFPRLGVHYSIPSASTIMKPVPVFSMESL